MKNNGGSCASAYKLSTGVDPDSKVHVANMGPNWVLSAPDGPHVGPMNLAIKGAKLYKAEMEALNMDRIYTLKYCLY